MMTCHWMTDIIGLSRYCALVDHNDHLEWRLVLSIQYVQHVLWVLVLLYLKGYWLLSTWHFTDSNISPFYAPQLCRQVLLRARISYGNSVCPSVRLSVILSVTTRYGFHARWDRDSGSSPYDSLESLVSYEVIWRHWVKRFPSNEGIK